MKGSSTYGQNDMNIYKINLQLFGEGDGDGAGAEGSAQAEQTLAKSNDKNPLAGVVYGKSAAVSTTENAEVSTPVDRNKEFEQLIKGDYKEAYESKLKANLDSRMKSANEKNAKLDQALPLFEMLGSKYGADANDIGALLAAVEQDNSFYEDEALEKGITVEQLKDMKKMERENRELKAQMEAQRTQQQAAQTYAQWQNEAAQCQQVYPSFDLQSELQNDQFRNLLLSGVNLQTAFEVLHKDEIIPAAMQYTAKQVEQKLVNKVISGGMRPNESGTNRGSSAVVKTDVTQLTKADRQEIARRVARGEKISF